MSRRMSRSRTGSATRARSASATRQATSPAQPAPSRVQTTAPAHPLRHVRSNSQVNLRAAGPSVAVRSPVIQSPTVQAPAVQSPAVQSPSVPVRRSVIQMPSLPQHQSQQQPHRFVGNIPPFPQRPALAPVSRVPVSLPVSLPAPTPVAVPTPAPAAPADVKEQKVAEASAPVVAPTPSAPAESVANKLSRFFSRKESEKPQEKKSDEKTAPAPAPESKYKSDSVPAAASASVPATATVPASAKPETKVDQVNKITTAPAASKDEHQVKLNQLDTPNVPLSKPVVLRDDDEFVDRVCTTVIERLPAKTVTKQNLSIIIQGMIAQTPNLYAEVVVSLIWSALTILNQIKAYDGRDKTKKIITLECCKSLVQHAYGSDVSVPQDVRVVVAVSISQYNDLIQAGLPSKKTTRRLTNSIPKPAAPAQTKEVKEDGGCKCF